MMKRTGTPVTVTSASPFYAVEGIDGSGKTRFVSALAERLPGCVSTREPSAPDANPFARILSNNRVGNTLSPSEQYWLFQLDRGRHAKDVIRPALDKGEVVITDRSFLSTAAYQASHLGEEAYRKTSQDAFELGYPSPLFILIDMDPELAMQRLRDGREQLDDVETLNQLVEIGQRYRHLIREADGIIIDGSLEVEDKISQLLTKCSQSADTRARYLVNFLR